jgi:RimJ/RimL family protein N-acetyltransferase
VRTQEDPAVSRYTGVYDRDGIVSWLAEVEREWSERGHGRVAIADPEDDRMLGRTGLKYLPAYGETELGWTLGAGARGRGIATEAAAAALAWGFERLDVPCVTALIDFDNAPSIAVAERLGMTPLREDVYEGDALTVYAISREAFALSPR